MDGVVHISMNLPNIQYNVSYTDAMLIELWCCCASYPRALHWQVWLSGINLEASHLDSLDMFTCPRVAYICQVQHETLGSNTQKQNPKTEV